MFTALVGIVARLLAEQVLLVVSFLPESYIHSPSEGDYVFPSGKKACTYTPVSLFVFTEFSAQNVKSKAIPLTGGLENRDQVNTNFAVRGDRSVDWYSSLAVTEFCPRNSP